MRYRLLDFLLVLVLGVGGPRCGLAQPEGLRADSILRNLTILDLAPDPAGYLWVAATQGAYRFDGRRLMALSALAHPGSDLPRRLITSLLVDGDSVLWLGADDGLFVLHRQRGQLRRIPLPPGEQRVTGLHLLDRRLWFNTGEWPGRLWLLNTQRPNAAPVEVDRPAPAQWLRRRPDGGLFAPAPDTATDWLFASTGRFLGGAPAPHRRGVLIDAAGRRRPFDDAHPLVVPGSGGRWLLSPRGYWQRLANGQRRLEAGWSGVLRENQRPEVQVYELAGAWYWTAGARVYSLPLGEATPTVRYWQPAGRWYYNLLRSPDGAALWLVSPKNKGVVVLTPHTPRATPLRPRLARGVISTRLIDRLSDGRLVVSSYDGLFTQAADSPLAPLRRWRTISEVGVWLARLPLPDGRWLIANEYGGFSLLTGDRLVPCSATPSADQQLGHHAFSLLRTTDGRYWGGASRGLYLLDPAGRRVSRWDDANPASPLHDTNVWALVEAPRGTLWLGTSTGLYRLTLRTHQLVRYGPDEPPSRRLPVADIRALLPLSGDTLALATLTHGLLLLRPDRGFVRAYGPTEGLRSLTVWSGLYQAATRELWLGTDVGVTVLHLPTGNLRHYTEADGLAAREQNRQSAWRDPRTGWLYLGGVGGVSLIRSSPRRVPTAPRLLLTALEQHHARTDTVVVRYPAAAQTHVAAVLAPGDAFVKLSVTLSDFVDTARQQFQYRLSGSGSRAWTPFVPPLRLFALAPGSYTFHMRGRSAQGVWARNQAQLDLTVLAPWWQRPLTWLLACLGAIALTVAAVTGWQRVRERQRQAERQLRTQLAADLHDEVGALLTRINLRAELLLQEQASPHLTSLVLESQTAMGTMRDIIWSVNTEEDAIGSLTDRLADLVEHTEQAAPWPVRLRLPEQFDSDRRLRPNVRQHAYLIAKEAVTNALKHAPEATELTISVELSGAPKAALRLDVRHDGALPTGPPRPGGRGQHNMRHRAALIGGTLTSGALPAGGWAVMLVVSDPLVT